MKKIYNVPVQIACHPEVKNYIDVIIQGMRPLLTENALEKVSLVILDRDHKVVEKFVFEVVTRAANKFESAEDAYLLRLEQSLREFLMKLNTCDSLLWQLPKDTTWTVHVHTKESSAESLLCPKAIQEFTWMEASGGQPEINNPRIVPLKSFQSSHLQMQLYVEESTD